MNQFNTVIIGGGFYGLRIALYLYDVLGVRDILIIEKESSMMSRASYVNQARVHNGYHYPRSVLTGYRSAVNFPHFIDEYKDSVVSDFEKYYGVAKHLSKVNAHQFVSFCKKIGVPIEVAPDNIQKLFDEGLTEQVFKVKEYAFDSHKLRDSLLRQINDRPAITLHNTETVQRVASFKNASVAVYTNRTEYIAQTVLNCSYSQINTIHRASNLPLVELKHEVTEMCLIDLPKEYKNFSITMMDGPFFSIMPFPSRGLHSLSHVRYTPHESWLDNDDTDSSMKNPHRYFKNRSQQSNYRQMYADVVRYIPTLKNMKYIDSIREVKTVLVKSEGDDSRPILFKPHFGMRNYTCIMGGKLDNIYDVFGELEKLYEE